MLKLESLYINIHTINTNNNNSTICCLPQTGNTLQVISQLPAKFRFLKKTQCTLGIHALNKHYRWLGQVDFSITLCCTIWPGGLACLRVKLNRFHIQAFPREEKKKKKKKKETLIKGSPFTELSCSRNSCETCYVKTKLNGLLMDTTCTQHKNSSSQTRVKWAATERERAPSVQSVLR